MHEDDDSEEKIVKKYLHTVCRVNPSSGYKNGAISVDSEYNQVTVSCNPTLVQKASNKSFVVDNVLDSFPKAHEEEDGGKKQKTIFASQSKVFDQIRSIIDSQIEAQSSDLLLLFNGASGSGKSYTLFGESNFEARGVLPRFVDYIFNHQGKNPYCKIEPMPNAPPGLQANQVLLSMMLVTGEQMIDLLHVNNPMRSWNSNGHLVYSKSLGPIATPAEYVLSKSAAELSDQLGMGLRVAAAAVHAIADLYASTSIVVNMLILSGEQTAKKIPVKDLFNSKSKSDPNDLKKLTENMRVTKVTFMELPSLDNPLQCPIEVDRLTGVSPQFRAARSLKLDPLLAGAGGEHAYIPEQFNAHHRKSIVNYLLQDAFYKHPNAIVVTCLRGAEHSYFEDVTAMELMSELTEHVMEDAAPRSSLLVSEWVSILENEIAICEQTATVNSFAEFVQAKSQAQAEVAAGGKEKKGAFSGLKTATHKAIRRSKDVKPVYEYIDIAIDDAGLQRSKANFLRKLADTFILVLQKDSVSEQSLERLCNYCLPFVSAFDSSMNLPRRGMVIDYEQIANPASKVPFTDVLRSWLRERGMYMQPLKKKISAGAFDGLGLEDEDEEDIIKPIDPAVVDFKQNTVGLAHGVPWSFEIEGMEPYAVMLSPNSGLAEAYGKIPLLRGTTVIRGKSGNTFLSENESMSIYTTTPTEKDCEKDVQTYRASLRDLCGEDIIPRIALDILEKEIAAEEALAIGAVGGAQAEDEEEEENLEKTEAPTGVNFVFLPGPAVEPLHAIFRVENTQFLFIRPNKLLTVNGKSVLPEVFVNGLPLNEEIPLQDNDIVLIGKSRFLQIRVPVKPMKMNELNSIAKEEKFSELTAWERGMVRGFSNALKEAVVLSEGDRRHVSHIAINRELTAVMKNAERNALHRMETYAAPDELVESVYLAIPPNDRAYLCNIIGASNLINFWAKQLRRYMKTTFQLMSASPTDQSQRGRLVLLNSTTLAASVAAQATTNQGKKKKEIKYDEFGLPIHDEEDEFFEPVVVAANPLGRRKGVRQVGGNNTAEATAEARLFSGGICCENEGDQAGKFLWNCPILIERLYLMKKMAEQFYSPWCSRDTAWLDTLYEPDQDPFNDTQEDELIGVGYLYLDGLQYLVDTNDIVPIVSLQGHRCGAIKVKGRVWVDKIETAPPYLTVDKETNLREFDGKNCVLRLYIESLMDLPQNQCSSTFVRFNFFYHNKPYSTPRHGGSSMHPFMHSAIRIDQRITGDFLEYIARGSLELEVYGKRKVKESRRPGLGALLKHNFLTGEPIPVIKSSTQIANEEQKHELAEAKEEKAGNEVDYEEKLRELTINLQKSQNSISTNKKIIDNLNAEKQKLEEKIKRQEAKFAEFTLFEETLPPKFRRQNSTVAGAGSVKEVATDGSAACRLM